jgi:hypothetical protein
LDEIRGPELPKESELFKKMKATAPSNPLCEGTSDVVVEHELVGTRAGLHLVDLAGAL